MCPRWTTVKQFSLLLADGKCVVCVAGLSSGGVSSSPPVLSVLLSDHSPGSRLEQGWTLPDRR